MLLKALNRTLEEYNIPKEEFWEDPYGFIDKLEDEDLKWLLLMEMEGLITGIMKREFKSGEVVLEVYDASLRIVMDRLLPPYKDNGDCSYTINIAGNENFGGGFPREYVEKQVDEYLDTIRDFIIEGLISKGNNHKSDK